MNETDRGSQPLTPMSEERLGTPEMQARIAKAKARAIASQGGGRGKIAEDLERLAREHRDVDART